MDKQEAVILMGLGNATGWAELMNGSIAKAAYKTLDHAVGGTDTTPGYLLVILLFAVQAMIYIRTRNLGMALIIGLVLYTGLASIGVATQYIPTEALGIIILVFVLELAAILWHVFAR